MNSADEFALSAQALKRAVDAIESSSAANRTRTSHAIRWGVPAAAAASRGALAVLGLATGAAAHLEISADLLRGSPNCGSIGRTAGSDENPAHASVSRALTQFQAEIQMRDTVRSFVAAATVGSATLGASAQQSVQWRVQDGGNGHWYTVVTVPNGITWTAAREAASSRGGYLATIRSAPEAEFVRALAESTDGAFGTGSSQLGPWIGGSRIGTAPGWRWMSGETWSFTNWCSGQPNGGAEEPYAHLSRTSSQVCWSDRADGSSGDGNPSFVVESHTTPNGPIGPVQWSIQSGGNGHWYELVIFPSPISWSEAKSAAEDMGGHLATLSSASENAWVFSNIAQFAGAWLCGQDCYGPWLGGFQDRSASDFSEPSGGWRWVTGEPWQYTAWEPNLPNNAGPLQDYLHYYGPSSPSSFFTPAAFWDDIHTDVGLRSLVVEYEADCNDDGLVDIGQIRSGAVPDVNHNGVPDVCECIGDTNGNGAVNGVDLSAVLGAWGTDGQDEGGADINNDGIVNGQDLAFVLSAWGPCSSVPAWATLIEYEPDITVVTDPNLQAAISATGLPWRVRDSGTGIEFVLIPPGTFQMGCSPSAVYGCQSSENPVHTVTLTNAFYMGRYEVTQAQWTARMGANPSWFRFSSAHVPADQVPNRPVEQVSWNMIQGFLGATGMRLPTEAEWEYAYRAGTATAFHSTAAYPSGTNDDSTVGTFGWSIDSSANQTRPVGQLSGNGFGLHDMSGNVWEWVNDWYSASYYAASPLVDPSGPTSGSSRVLRGGGWFSGSLHCRSSSRADITPASGNNSNGFRVARNP